MADGKRDYYEVLGIPKGAGIDDIKRSYRALAKKHHPDLNKDNIKESEEKFKEVSEAYEVLADDQKRKLYDQYGHQGVSQTFGEQGFTWDNFTHFSDLEDMFSDFGFFSGQFDLFGRRRTDPNAPRKGDDLRYDMEISLEDSARGVDREVEVPHTVGCPECSGTGAEKGSAPKTCPRCSGTGQTRNVRSQGYSQLITIGECSACRGRGQIIERPCRNCRGSGRLARRDRISITIPAGADNGIRLRVSGGGEAGVRGGPPGNLYVVLHIRRHPRFQREGDNLLLSSELSYAQAALGGEIEVQTLDGTARVTVPAGTQTHTVLRLAGKGMPRFDRAGRGDLFVRVRVATPQGLSERQKELLREFAREGGEELGEKKGFFKRPVKK